jgi:peptidoglycan hydrolase-like protein with peptidoglycan-binding domain
MVDPRSPRFFADGVLASCLTGHKISQASGDPVGTVARLQQAIVDLNDSDLGALLAVDGIFGPLTGTAITKYKAKHGLIPADAVVEQATFSLLDDYYEHELIEDHAQALQSSFDIGSRIGNRTELVSGVVLCPFQHGQCVEFGRFRIILMPEASSKAWKQAGGISGSFGLPTNDPFKLDATRAAQEFEDVVLIFFLPPAADIPFAIPRWAWEASISGSTLIGFPTGAKADLANGNAQIVPHDSGVVLKVENAIPLPLSTSVFNAWKVHADSGDSLGGPTGSPFLDDQSIVYRFQFGQLVSDLSGNVIP